MSLLEDLSHAARSLARRPALLAVTTLTLSIAIAANAVMFGVVDQLLLRPPPHVAAPERVHRVYFQYRDSDTKQPAHGSVTTYPAIAAVINGARSLEVAAFSHSLHRTLGAGPGASSVEVQVVSGNYFSMLGVHPALGRALLPSDDRVPKGEFVAVVSNRFWRNRLGADVEAVGRVVRLNGQPYTIVGVAPSGFSGLDRVNIDFWVPLSAMAPSVASPTWHSEPNNWWLEGVARLRTGHPKAAATAATNAYRAAIKSWNRPFDDTTASVVLGSIVGARTPDGLSNDGKVSLWLIGVAAIVLIIACANVANLLIARTYQRRREIAVRLTLGSSRGRLFQLLLAEAALLAGIGAVIALLVAAAASRFVQTALMPGIVWSDNVTDTRVLVFTLLATTLCVILAGVAPAVQGSRTQLSESLKAASVQVTGKARFRHALLVVQATLSVVLLIGAGLFVRSLNRVLARDVGIDLDRVLLVRADLEGMGLSSQRVVDVYREALERVSRLPNVASASLVRQTVPSATGSGMRVTVPGLAEPPHISGGGPYYAVVDANYFATMGTAILRGRNFTSAEERSKNRALIVNRMVAEAYWPGTDPVGRCAKLGSDTVCSTVVGVVENMMLFNLVKDDRALVYVAPGHVAFGNKPPAALVVRPRGEPMAAVPSIRSQVQSLAPNMPFVSIQPFTERVAWQLRPWRLGATMFSTFGLIALIIAAVGLYSVMAYWVAQRTHEIGIRMALGAQRWDVVRLVAWQSSQAVILGVVVGSLLAVVMSRWVQDLLYETSPREPVVYAGAAIALVVAGVLASVIPARRSTTLDPARAIRME